MDVVTPGTVVAGADVALVWAEVVGLVAGAAVVGVGLAVVAGGALVGVGAALPGAGRTVLGTEKEIASPWLGVAGAGSTLLVVSDPIDVVGSGGVSMVVLVVVLVAAIEVVAADTVAGASCTAVPGVGEDVTDGGAADNALVARVDATAMTVSATAAQAQASSAGRRRQRATVGVGRVSRRWFVHQWPSK